MALLVGVLLLWVLLRRSLLSPAWVQTSRWHCRFPRRLGSRAALASGSAASQAEHQGQQQPGAVPAEWADIAVSPHDPNLWEEDGVVLGQGAFGVVARGINKETGELVAIKRIAPTHKLAIATAKNEVEAALALGEHPNVVQMKAHFLARALRDGQHSEMVLVYRFALGGNLQDWISQQHGHCYSVDYSTPKLTDESLRIMTQLATGLEHIHAKGIQHRDLKPPNILLSAGGTALVADFGIALVNRSSTREAGHAALGDFYFMDVDSLVTKALPYTLDDDVYSLGEVFVRILYGGYATGSELRRFMEQRGDAAPAVTRILADMLRPRDDRCSLAVARERLQALGFRTLPSEPRPIVTGVFLGIGAVVTAATIAEQVRTRSFAKRPSSVFSSRSRLPAVFRVGRAQGKRRFMEDYYCHARVEFNLRPQARSWRLLGLFDGHGGKDCAKFAARFLPHEVRRMLREAERGERDPGTVPCLADLREAAGALRRALSSLDGLFVKFKRKNPSTQGFGYAGTTAATALLSPDGRHAVLCNLGDSRAALAGGWEVAEHLGAAPELAAGVVVTHPHSPGDPAEAARIEREGGFVELGARGHRVNGVLAVSRAIGYAGVPELAAVSSNADYVIAERRNTTQPAVVALATDGVFEGGAEASEVFQRLGSCGDGQSLGECIQAELDRAGGANAEENVDNATLLACLMPAAS